MSGLIALAEQHGVSAEDLKIARTILDPVQFANYWMQDNIWDIQARIMRSVATRSRTAVKACHASGKTYLAGDLALWWITRYPDGIVITTAPGWTQVEKMVWAEIHGGLRRTRVGFPQPTKTELYRTEDNYIVGMATREGVRFQGFHGRVLIIIDEAMGVKGEIFDAIEGIRAGGDVRLLILGNPTEIGGPFYDAFNNERALYGDGLYTISAFDTPNLIGLTLEDVLTMSHEERAYAPWPMLTKRQWVYEVFHKWGGSFERLPGGKILINEPTDAKWASRVLGEFPAQPAGALFSSRWLEAAQRRPPTDVGGPLRAGIDVAGPGEDETVLIIVNPANGAILAHHAWAEEDPRKKCVRELGRWKDRLEVVNVDSIGIGHYFGKHIEDQGFTVGFVNVARKARNKLKYKLRKDEYYWALRNRIEAGLLAGLTDNTLFQQLAAIKYEEDAGRTVIESKDEMKERGVKSPDRAEALMLAFAESSRSSIGGVEVGADRDDPDDQERAEKPYESQFASSPIGAAHRYAQRREYSTCGDCAHFKPSPVNDQVGKCELRLFSTSRAAAECEYFEAKG